MLKGTEGCTV